MRKFSLKSKKGVSPIIATLLLIIIAVAAAVVTYSFVMGFIGGAGTGQSGQAQFVVDTYSIDSTTDTVLVYLRNIGTKTVGISSVYINGKLQDPGRYTLTDTADTPVTNMNPANVYKFTIQDDTDLIVGSNNLKLVFNDATPFEFNVLYS